MMAGQSVCRATGLMLIVLLFSTKVDDVYGQSTVPLTTDPGSSVTVTLELDIETTVFGTLSGSDTDSAPAAGTGRKPPKRGGRRGRT